MNQQNGTGRRDVLKALAGLPILGVLGLEALRKFKYDSKHDARKVIIHELGLDDVAANL